MNSEMLPWQSSSTYYSTPGYKREYPYYPYEYCGRYPCILTSTVVDMCIHTSTVVSILVSIPFRRQVPLYPYQYCGRYMYPYQYCGWHLCIHTITEVGTFVSILSLWSCGFNGSVLILEIFDILWQVSVSIPLRRGVPFLYYFYPYQC